MKTQIINYENILEIKTIVNSHTKFLRVLKYLKENNRIIEVFNHESIELIQFVSSDRELLQVQKYLKENNLAIKSIDCTGCKSAYDRKHVFLEGVLLSNGFGYTTTCLTGHILFHKEYLKIKDTDEYKLYLKLKRKYSNFKNFN